MQYHLVFEHKLLLCFGDTTEQGNVVLQHNFFFLLQLAGALAGIQQLADAIGPLLFSGLYALGSLDSIAQPALPFFVGFGLLLAAAVLALGLAPTSVPYMEGLDDDDNQGSGSAGGVTIKAVGTPWGATEGAVRLLPGVSDGNVQGV